MTTVMNFTTSGHFGSQNHRFFSMDGSQQCQELWFGEDQHQVKHMPSAKSALAPTPAPAQTPKRPAINISNIRVIPYTDLDWKRALAEVKRDYTNKKYRACAEKCKALLASVKCPETVQPTYMIYMHFYAATSIEMQVRGFQMASPYRIKLLQDARQHYRLAAALAKSADERLSRVKSLFPQSPPSSLGSPVESVMSCRSGTSTRMSSPTPSDDSTGSFTQKAKKKVSFADELSYGSGEEPYVRPDSPTLGPSDPASGRSSPCFESLPASVVEDTSDMATPTPASMAQFAKRPEPQGFSPSFTRYCLILSSIQRQISTHLNSIERDIDAALYPRPAVPLDEEMRALELQSRIERLRATGWQRKRFDTQRYEDFRERAMADMLE